jgi:hypothetical protein
MSINEAVESLRQKLGEPDVFIVRHDGTTITVDVNFVYRVEEVKALGDKWQDFPLQIGRRSCW